MEINLDLGLVSGQFDESNVGVDDDMNVSGVLSLSGLVDDEWSAAFDAAAPTDGPWALDDTPAIRFGPIPVREFSAQIARLRKQITAANESVEAERHRRAMAAHIEAQERERAHRQAIDALSSMFGRRLSSLDDGERQAA